MEKKCEIKNCEAQKKGSEKKKIIKTIVFLFFVIYLVLFGLAPLKENGLFKDISLKEPTAFGSSIVGIPEKYKNLAPGDELVAEVRLYQFESNNKRDVMVDYEIQDINGKTVLKQHETVAVETQASFLKTFNLPSDMSPGRYILFSNIKNLDSSNIFSSTTSFEISKPVFGYKESNPAPFYSKNVFLIISLFLILILAGYFVLAYRRRDLAATGEEKDKKIGYEELIGAIVKNNRFFGGQKAIKLANRIKGLKVSPEGRVLKLESREIEIMVTLIDLYRISIGQSSIKIARKAIENLLYQNPKLKVPKELKPAT